MSDSNEMDYFDDSFEKMNGDQDYYSEGPKRKPVLLILSIIFFILGFSFICLQQYFEARIIWKNPMGSFSYALGGLLVILVIFFMSSKKKVLLLIISIIYFIASFSSMTYAYGNSIIQANKFKIGEEKLVDLCKDVYLTNKVPNETYDKSKYGDMAELLTNMNGYLSKTTQLYENYEKDLSATGYDSVLQVENVKSIENINNSKKKLEAVKKIFNKYEVDYANASHNLTKDVEKTDMPQSIRKDFISIYTKAEQENYKKMSSLFKVKRAYINKLDGILDFLLSRTESYTVKNNKVYFNDEADLKKFRDYTKELDDLHKEEEQIIYDYDKVQKANIEMLDKLK